MINQEVTVPLQKKKENNYAPQSKRLLWRGKWRRQKEFRILTPLQLFVKTAVSGKICVAPKHQAYALGSNHSRRWPIIFLLMLLILLTAPAAT